jgi:hypothetical protein
VPCLGLGEYGDSVVGWNIDFVVRGPEVICFVLRGGEGLNAFYELTCVGVFELAKLDSLI